MERRLRLLVTMSAALILLAAGEGIAGTFTAFGPQTFERGGGRPTPVVATFSVLNPNTSYFLTVRNGAPEQGLRRVSSGLISVNGVPAIGPSDLNQRVESLERSVALDRVNEVAVELRSNPGGGVVVEVVGIDDEPPIITAAVSPTPNANGWNNTDATVRFTCDDTISGVAVCPDPVLLTAESAGHVVTGTAIDHAGNTASATVTVRLDKTPPSIGHAVSPTPNANGWNNTDATVSFVCDDALSGVASCSAPVTRSAETAGDVVLGAGVDRAGNVVELSVTVRIDKTAPRIARTWPPADVFSTDRADVPVEGALADDLSGVETGVLQDFTGSVTLAVPDFAVVRAVQTDIPAGATSRDTTFDLSVTDRAGNSGQQTFLVRHTQDAHMLPTDPARTVVFEGVVTAVDRALVRFGPSVSRDRIHEVAGEHGGRVAGYLPGANVALVIFDTTDVADLEAILQGLQLRAEVETALAVILFTEAFDNDALSPTDGIAYRRIRLPEAADFVVRNNLPMSPTTIAVIDSGLDTTFGLSDEFDDINFFDLCASTPLGQTPTDDDGHGTGLTGVIAGANNGAGNNGLIRGFPASLFEVHVFRTKCDPASGLDGALLALAMDLVVSGTGSLAGIGVVNMSFGLGSDTDEGKAFLASFFEPFVRSARGDDILWVASAGNNDREARCDGFLLFPAGLACTLPNVVSVGGFDPSSLDRAPLSNFGDGITLYAPGSNVHTAVGPGLYGAIGQTSASAAVVTGAAGLLLALNPQPPSAVKELLRLTTQPLSDPVALAQGGLDLLALVEAGAFAPLRRDTFSGDSSGGLVITGATPSVAFPGLAGFLLNFDSGDHHIQNVWAGFFQEAVGQALILDYSDGNADDDYSWTVDRQELPPGTTVHEVTGSTSTGINRVIQPPGFVGVPVLLGFGLTTVSGGDHHLKRIRVELFVDQFGQLELGMTFQDDGDDVTHQYRVAYALIPPDRVRAAGTLSGSSSGSSVSASVNLEQPVLQGFTLTFTSGDHHLDRLGVRLQPGQVRIFYDDQNDDDAYTWSVRYVDVR